MSDLLKVIVKRSEWGDGHTLARLAVSSMLYNPDSGKMCCLGFACVTAGYTKEQIAHHCYPGSLPDLPPALKLLVKDEYNPLGQSLPASNGSVYTSAVAIDLARTNDTERYNSTKAAREAEIIELGVKAGIAFEFID